MKKYLKKIIGFCVFIILIFLMTKFTDYSHELFLKKFQKAKFEGKVVKKYIDTKQHNYQMLVIKKKKEEIAPIMIPIQVVFMNLLRLAIQSQKLKTVMK